MCGDRCPGARKTRVASRRRREAGELGLGGWGGREAAGRRGVPGRERRRSSALPELGRRVPEREAGGGCSPRRRREVRAEARRGGRGRGRGPRPRSETPAALPGAGRRGARLLRPRGTRGRDGEVKPKVHSFMETRSDCCAGWEPGEGRQDLGSARGCVKVKRRVRGGQLGETPGGGDPRPGSRAGPVSAPGVGGEGRRAPRADGKELGRAGRAARSGRAGRAAVGAGSRGPDRGGAEPGSPLT